MNQLATLPETELAFLARMLEQDAKNYHVWSYRHWLVRRFSLWDGELAYVDTLLQNDVRNNSAWNHRWFVVFCRATDPAVHGIQHLNNNNPSPTDIKIKLAPTILEREIEYAKHAIRAAPQNMSPWNYLRAVLRNQGRGLAALKHFAEDFADVEREDQVRSSHALDFLADLYAAAADDDDDDKEQGRERAAAALQLLARRFDPIRRNYWNYRQSLLGAASVES